MTFLSTCGNKYIAVSIKNHLKILNANDGTLFFDFSNKPSSTTVETAKTPTENSSNNNNGINIICHAFSRDQTIFAALTEDKRLLTWMLNGTAELHQDIEFPKRPTWLTFLHKEKSVIVSDKYGDIYKCGLSPSSKPILTLGHLSMVLTVCISTDDKYIVSGDRDEKIRISYYPNAYSIHSYCLGHRNLVSSTVQYSENLLLSTSADKTLRLWDFVNGTELHSFDLTKCIEEKDFVPSQLALDGGNKICLIAEKVNTVHIFEISDNEISHVYMHTLGELQPLSISTLQDGSFAVLTTNKQKPIVVLGKYEQNYKELDLELNSNLMDLASDLPMNCTYLTSLVKPMRGKRDGTAITPEATINYDPLNNIPNKMQKLQEERGEEKPVEE